MSHHEWLNCTITGNRAAADGGVGGLFFEGGRTVLQPAGYTLSVEIRNTIVWGNIGLDIVAVRGIPTNQVGVAVEVEFSDIGSADGSTLGNPAAQFVISPALNISVDPIFVNPSNSNYKLRYDIQIPANTSPCIDAGVDGARGQDITDLNDNGNFTEALPNDLRRVDILRSPPLVGFARLVDLLTTGSPAFGQTIDMGAFEQNKGIQEY